MINEYFKADIAAAEYYDFNENFKKFRAVYPSYFSKNVVKELDQYEKIFSTYHKNNLKRDKIFADILEIVNYGNGNLAVKNTEDAEKYIAGNLKNKKIKVIVTGGFHSEGLEKYLEERKISYAVITPKITQSADQAKQIYLNTISGYSEILSNAINIEPLTQESLNISFPKVLASTLLRAREIFADKNISQREWSGIIKSFIEENVLDAKNGYGDAVLVKQWEIKSFPTDSGPDIRFLVTYVDKANNNMESRFEYVIDKDGVLHTYAQIDGLKTGNMIKKYITGRKYAEPSIELELDDRARKKVNALVIEPLKAVSSDKISFMPFGQLHTTVGYDSTSAMTDEQVETLIAGSDKSDSIFADTENLGKVLISFKAPLDGVLKLMPDGVIIYEITNREIVSQMLELRAELKKDSKYKSPRIVHITLGRINDLSILDQDNPQSRRELAELTEKLNEKIYEINKKKALSKVKSRFTVKGGYVSVTGDRDFLVTRIFPKTPPALPKLSIIKLSQFYQIFIAPICEEFVFRYLPFALTVSMIGSPVSFIPLLVTSLVGTVVFSTAHTAADKLSLVLQKIPQKEINNPAAKAVKRLFASMINAGRNTQVRDWKEFLVPSAILTASYIAVSLLLPGTPLIALAVTAFMHSGYNFIVSKRFKNLPVLSIASKPENESFGNAVNSLLKNIKSVSADLQNKKTKFNGEKIDIVIEKINKIAEDIEKANVLKGENRLSAVQNSLKRLIGVMTAESAGESESYVILRRGLLSKIICVSVYFDGDMFDELINFCISESYKGSSDFLTILLDSAASLYSVDKQYTHRILDKLYKNKSSVKSVMDYGKFAVPLPSPFSFETDDEWEIAADEIIRTSPDIYPVWYNSMIDLFLSINKEYAYAILRSLYRNGLQTTPPFLDTRKHGYEWAKEFYVACGNPDEIFITEQSVPLLKFGDIKNITENSQILETNNIYLSDIISRLQYLKKEEYKEIIETLKQALDLSREEQLTAVTEQMNKVYGLLFSTGTDRIGGMIDTLELLAPIFAFIKNSNTKNTLLADALEQIKEKIKPKDSDSSQFFSRSYLKKQEVISVDLLIKFVPIVYSIDRNLGLSLIRFIFAGSRQKETILARGDSKPSNVKEAYSKIPESLRGTIKTYGDLELFYDVVGIPFDSMEEQSIIYDREKYVPGYETVLSRLPSEILGQIKAFEKSKKYFRSLKLKDAGREQSAVYFDALDSVLANNVLALAEINNLNEDSMYDAVYFVEEMIKSFEIINEEHGKKAGVALENIKEFIKNSHTTAERQAKLTSWTADKIDEIKELHTLINAVHQTSIADFMSLMKYSEAAGKKTTLKDGGYEQFDFYNCSVKTLSPQMKDLLANLSAKAAKGMDPLAGENAVKLIVKDDKLIWTKQLGAHSVDILIDMNEGIRVNFNDSGRGDGNALRVVLLAALLSQAGFEITSIDTRVAQSMMDDSVPGVCELKAFYVAPNSLNIGEVYADLFSKAVDIVGSTTNLDYTIENTDVDKEKHEYGKYQVPHLTVDDFKKIRNSSDMPKGFELVSSLSGQWEVRFKSMKRQTSEKENGELNLDKAYEYLGIKEEEKSPWVIVRKYVEGKIHINKKTGILEPNEKYDRGAALLEEIDTDIDETLRQAQLINLLDYNGLHLETEGYIGGLIAVSGVMKLNGDGWLSIKGAVDKERKRMKCAYVEYVDFDGNRTKLGYQELLDLLKKEGYAVKKQKPRSKSEKEATIKSLKEEIAKNPEAIYIRGRGVSENQEGYVPAKIVYEKENVEENSMWVVSYTTPEDVETIIKAKGLMTTGGGMLSHANITARENNKTAILSSGQWVDGKLEVVYYTVESGVENKRGYQTQKISEHKIKLEEGNVILANGATGRILLFNGIKEDDINKIQKAVDDMDVPGIKKFLEEYGDAENVGKLIEYIFLQSVWDENKRGIIDLLLSWDKGTIKDKVSELNGIYVKAKLEKIKENVWNLEGISDEKVSYGIIIRLEKETETIKTTTHQKDVEQLKEIIKRKKQTVLLGLDRYVKETEKEIDKLLSKDILTEEDKNRMTKISEAAKAWKYYYGYEGIKEKIEAIDKIISQEDGRSYETEIKGFESITAKDVVRYGSKTTELAKMSRLFEAESVEGIKIPYGTGISKDVMKIFFDKAGKGQEYARLISDFEKAIAAGDKIKAKLIGKEIISNIDAIDSEELKVYMAAILEEGKRYAVRSSGVGEDGGNHAFAGMAKTKLNVGKNEVYAGIKECWKSFYSQTCIEDMLKQGVPVRPALLVQEMVGEIEKAGVMFTRDEDGNLTEEVVLGLGEGLVSGRINPDHITVRARDGKIEYVRALDNMKKIVGKAEGGTRQEQLTREEKIERVIDEEMINRLRKIAYLLEEDSGYPVDIEFGIDKHGNINILQRRAITTFVDENIDINGDLKSDFADIDQSMIDELLEKLKGISGRGVDKIISVRETLAKLPSDAYERYKIISAQVNLLFEYVKDNNGYMDFMVNYIAALSLFVNAKDLREPLFNSILSLFPMDDKENKKYDILSAAGKIIKQIYPFGVSYVIQTLRLLNREGLINYKEMPYSIGEALRKYNYDGLKTYYFAVAEPGVDGALSSAVGNFTAALKKIDFSVFDNGGDIIKNIGEIESLSDKINISTLPLLEYQLKILMNSANVLEEKDKQSSESVMFAVLTLCRQIVYFSNSLDKEIIEKFYRSALKNYDVNGDGKVFNVIISFLSFVAKNTDSAGNSETNKKAVECLAKIALNVYAPAKNKECGESEAVYRKKTCLDIFKMLSSDSPNNLSVYRSLFDSESGGMNLSADTLRIFLNAVNNGKYTEVSCPVPVSDSDIIYSPDIVDMLAGSCGKLNLVYTCQSLYDSGQNGKKLALAVISRLFDISNDASVKRQLAEDAVSSLARMASSQLYILLQNEKVFDIIQINKLCEKYGLGYSLKPVEKAYSITGTGFRRASSKDKYNFTPLLKKLPRGMLGETEIVRETPILFEVRGKTDQENEKIKTIKEKFNILQNILNDNTVALTAIAGLSKSDDLIKDFNSLTDIIKGMIAGLTKIDEKHGTDAKTALEKILSSMDKIDIDAVKKQISINKWSVDKIAEIREIHTLINAIHQTAISDFKQNIENITKIGTSAVKTVSATQNDTAILLYDLSDKKLSMDIINLIGKLSTEKVPEARASEIKSKYKINDFVCMDDLLVWTTRLFVHSVDIFMNFSDTDRGIKISYHEGGRTVGNSERVRYFTTVLEKLGFSVDADTKISYSGKDGVCGLEATLNKDFGLNDETDLSDIAAKVILLFKYSDMVDWDLGEVCDTYGRGSYEDMFDRFVEKFMAGEIWVNYAPNSQSCFGDKGRNLTTRLEKDPLDLELLRKILSYLGIPDNLPKYRIARMDQSELDKYFNSLIERAYAVGRIVLDENGQLKKNENYDVIEHLAGAISSNEEESLNQSRIINLVGRNKFNFKTVGYIGDLIAISGMTVLKDGSKLAVKGLINPKTRRMKYSAVELVTDTERIKINTKTLSVLLRKEGYVIPKQEWVNKKEHIRISSLLHRNVQIIDSPELRCTGTSEGNGTYVAGNVTFDKNKVNQDNILVLPYTTPDDIEAIKTSKAIITTGGGILSHAAITTREYGKPSVILNGASWDDAGLNILYYVPAGMPFKQHNLNIKKVEERTSYLKEGSRILVNGENGHILLFNDMDVSILDELQKFIASDDAEGIRRIIIDNSESKDIRRIIEYVYFQTIGDNRLKKTMFMLFSEDMPDGVKEKVKELNEGYIQDKIISIREGIGNLKGIANVNIAYSVCEMLYDKLAFIRTPDKRADLEHLKESIEAMRYEIKYKLYNFINALILTGREYLGKEKLSSGDVEKIVNILQQSNVYNSFVPESETNEYLQNIKAEWEPVATALEQRVKDYIRSKEINYGTEILNFDGIYAQDVYRFGSKTTELAKMYRLLKDKAGVIVPRGVGISSNVFGMFFDSIGLKAEYVKLTSEFENAVRSKDIDAAKRLAKEIIALINTQKDTDELDNLKKAVASVIKSSLRQNTTYSVRSSGVGEDSANNAFAGMGETLLNVNPENIYESVKKCWESFFSDRSVEYMATSGQIVKPAVLVQEMISVDKSSVIFSRDKYGNATVEALYGLGEGIVSGQLTPDTIVVDMNTGEVIDYSVATKDYKIVPSSEGTVRVPVESGVKARTFDYQTVKKLIDVVKILEQDSGYKLDIEAGIKDGQIYVLQRRPITKPETAKPASAAGGSKEEKKRSMEIIAGTVPEEAEVFVNISNPQNQEEAISVYLKNAEDGIITFCVDAKYSDLIENGQLGRLLADRINNDKVVMERLNGKLPLSARVAEGGVEMLPIFDIMIEKSITEKSVNIETDIERFRVLLAAA